MTNTDHADGFLREVLRGLAAEYGWSVPKPKESIALPDLTPYPDTYRWPNGRKTVVTLTAGALFTSTEGDTPLQLHASAPEVFFIAEGVPHLHLPARPRRQRRRHGVRARPRRD
jgi:hypothetical protein